MLITICQYSTTPKKNILLCTYVRHSPAFMVNWSLISSLAAPISSRARFNDNFRLLVTISVKASFKCREFAFLFFQPGTVFCASVVPAAIWRQMILKFSMASPIERRSRPRRTAIILRHKLEYNTEKTIVGFSPSNSRTSYVIKIMAGEIRSLHPVYNR
jgi:hypothetical protein